VGKARVISVIVGVAMTIALLGASTASAATLTGDYQFQGTRNSSGPGPVALDIGAGGNSFQSDNVFGTTRQVLRFPEGSGVQMFPAGVGLGSYSVVTTFRFDEVDGYRRILNPHNNDDTSSDRGLYEYSGLAAIYPDGPEVDSSQVVFAPNNYGTVVMTSEPPIRTKVYVNGSLVAEAPETIDVEGDALHFFKDEGTSTEQSAGAVSCIRVYSGALTDAEAGAIGASPTCGTVASPSVKKKKCKKHKKKHRAAEAKKKCKKHKKKR
jgi:hypothetical protein